MSKHSCGLILALGIASMQVLGQVVGVTNQKPEDMQRVPSLNLSTARHAAEAAAIPDSEKARALRNDTPTYKPLFDEQEPSKSTGFYHHYNFNGDYDPLHIKDADLIVTGELLSETPHLTPSKGFVYTTFSFRVSTILKGNKVAGMLDLERQGGFITLPSGKAVFVGIMNFGLPVPGYHYLLALKANPNSSYTILGGFALDKDPVIPLDLEGRRIGLLTKSSLIDRVKAKLATQR